MTNTKEALFYDKVDGQKVACYLCRHRCVIPDGKRGICGVRENREGILYTLVYGLPCAYHVDPVEKKPLFHFLPGSKAFSIATVGCNFQCLHCQNHEISQAPREGGLISGEPMSPDKVVELAERAGCRSISYTYTEPTIFFEYALDIAKKAKERGLLNNFVTNGYIEEEPLRSIRPYLDGANVDLKAFSDKFYRGLCKAELSKVLDTIRTYRSLNIWIELTTLVIPGHNDSDEELRDIARFIRSDLGVDTPWHVSAFYPTFKLLDAPRTKPQTLQRARAIGVAEGLRYVYVGNIPGADGEHTYCPGCGKAVIKRHGYSITAYKIAESRCAFCGAVIDGVGM
jgi:pyruvate formate lyase activating enzyme